MRAGAGIGLRARPDEREAQMVRPLVVALFGMSAPIGEPVASSSNHMTFMSMMGSLEYGDCRAATHESPD